MANDQYQVLAQIPRTKYDEVTRSNVEGFDITFKDFKTGTTAVIFVPSSQHDAAQVNALIMAMIQRIRAVGDL